MRTTINRGVIGRIILCLNNIMMETPNGGGFQLLPTGTHNIKTHDQHKQNTLKSQQASSRAMPGSRRYWYLYTSPNSSGGSHLYSIGDKGRPAEMLLARRRLRRSSKRSKGDV